MFSVQLLEEFFLFFSTEFDFSNYVVSVRSGCRTSITLVLDELKGLKYVETEANNSSSSNKDDLTCDRESTRADCSNERSLSTEYIEQQKTQGSISSSSDSSPKCGKRVEFKVSPLIVQDPFELTHNLTQNVSASALKHIIELMKDAHMICRVLNTCDNPKSSANTLLNLLTVCKTAKKRKNTNYHSFFVKYQQPIAGSCAAKLTTTRNVFLFVVESLEREFGLKCDTKCLAKSKRIDGQDSESSQSTVVKESQGAQSSEESRQSIKDNQGCTDSAGNDHNTKVEQNEDGKTEHIDEVGDNFSAVCTAFENTWTHCRRERRKSLQFQRQLNENNETAGKDMSTASSQEQLETVPAQVEKLSSSTHSSHKWSDSFANVTSTTSPILIFELKVNSPSQKDSLHGCTVSMEHVESQEFQLFGNFFSAYKNYFMGLMTR